jgi:hypothetical protein
MHCRLRHVVATLAIIAASSAGLQAADELNLNTGRFTIRATVATNELHVEGGRPPAGAAAAHAVGPQTQVVVAGGRAAVSAKARMMLATGEAARTDPILYLNGQVSAANRVVATRRILLQAVAGQDPAALAAAHGLRLTKPSPAQAGWWIAEPISNDVYAAIDAAASLSLDARAALAMPILQMPVETYHVPTDPVFVAGYQWHLLDAWPGIRVREVWDTWKGEGTNVSISDTGMQLAHPDLSPNVRISLSYDYKDNDTDPNPGSANENHATAVAGMAAAAGDNSPLPLGVVGVAFKSGIIANRVLSDFDVNAIGASSLAPDDRMYDAMMTQASASRSSDLTWANNNSWGPGGGNMGGPLPLIFAGMRDATTYGRGGRGIPIIFACGNSGTRNPNNVQNTSAFDGYLNRYTIGVAALGHSPAGHKATYSSTGPNITTSAPGGDYVNSRTGLADVNALGVSTTDRTANDGYVRITTAPYEADFDLDGFVRPTSALLYENGDYVPPTYYLQGTSFAAPIVTGCAALMLQSRPELSWRDIRQIMIHRGQDQVPVLPPFVSAILMPHNDWGYWRPNGANLNYNNWYGFGAVDMGRFVFGGTGTSVNATATTALDEPGSLRWPLLPPMLTTPLSYSQTFPLPLTGATSDPTALFDAPNNGIPVEKNDINNDLVFNGRKIEGIGDRTVNIAMPITAVPARFRVDTVELSVTLGGVGSSTYPPTVWPQGSDTPSYSWGQYEFRLTSPSGATCILGRQRPGAMISKGAATPFSWTFSEIFHTNESDVEGTWTLSVIDEVNNLPDDAANDPDNLNPPEARIAAVGIKIYGHQTYAQPSLSSTSASGVPSGSGDQTIELRGSGFGISESDLGVAQAYWYPDDLTGIPVELPTTYVDSSHVKVRIPTTLLDTSTPGQGVVAIANPAVVVGRSGTGVGAIDAFDNPFPVTPMPSSSTTNPSRYMKRCTDGDTKLIKYSRPPTLTPLPDVKVTGKGTVTLTTVADDPDVVAGLPVLAPETLTVSAVSFNPGMVGNPVVTQVTPSADGLGTYSIDLPVLNSASAFAIIQVSVTDGVTTTVRSFRIIHPTDLDASGCGGGMGLALIGIPLGVWLIRRRKRG